MCDDLINTMTETVRRSMMERDRVWEQRWSFKERKLCGLNVCENHFSFTSFFLSFFCFLFLFFFAECCIPVNIFIIPFNAALLGWGWGGCCFLSYNNVFHLSAIRIWSCSKKLSSIFAPLIYFFTAWTEPLYLKKKKKKKKKKREREKKERVFKPYLILNSSRRIKTSVFT